MNDKEVKKLYDMLPEPRLGTPKANLSWLVWAIAGMLLGILVYCVWLS